MKFQVFHVNPREKLKKKDDNNNLSHFFINFPSMYNANVYIKLLLRKYINLVKQAKNCLIRKVLDVYILIW